MVRFNTAQFHYNISTRQFMAESSTLGVRAGCAPYNRVYNDACDAGFLMISDRTGLTQLFVLEGEDKVEGEIAGWRFKSVDGRRGSGLLERATTHVDGLRVLIAND